MRTLLAFVRSLVHALWMLVTVIPVALWMVLTTPFATITNLRETLKELIIEPSPVSLVERRFNCG